MFGEAAYYSRMAIGLWQFMRTPPVPDPEGLIREQLQRREANFLAMVRHAIFGNPRNPYCRMFEFAGCSREDLERSVERDGLETALARLREEGIYLTHAEFKGQQPIVRNGREIPSTVESFLNPMAAGHYLSSSSGSRSRGVSSPRGIQWQLYREAWGAILDKEFGVAHRAQLSLGPILPSGWGVTQCVKASRRGHPVKRWYTVGGSMKDSGHYRAVTRFLVAEARLMGHKVPFPVYLKEDDYSPAAEWIARRRDEGAAIKVSGMVSACARVAAVAGERGLDISGTLFLVGGEALTDSKRELFEAAGAEVFPSYYISEVGMVGHACRRMTSGNCVHISRDTVAVIPHARQAPLADVEVPSLLFTPLLPHSPFVLINAEMDDSGVLGVADCDCSLSRLGFTGQISNIYSFGKLTGHGITLVGTDVVRILEKLLPARFGGAASDYQLVESETGQQTEISLRVSPRTGVTSPEEVRRFFLAELRKLYGGSLASRVWNQAGAFRVVVAEPFTTASGKVLSLHLLGPGRRDAVAS